MARECPEGWRDPGVRAQNCALDTHRSTWPRRSRASRSRPPERSAIPRTAEGPAVCAVGARGQPSPWGSGSVASATWELNFNDLTWIFKLIGEFNSSKLNFKYPHVPGGRAVRRQNVIKCLWLRPLGRTPNGMDGPALSAPRLIPSLAFPRCRLCRHSRRPAPPPIGFRTPRTPCLPVLMRNKCVGTRHSLELARVVSPPQGKMLRRSGLEGPALVTSSGVRYPGAPRRHCISLCLFSSNQIHARNTQGTADPL